MADVAIDEHDVTVPVETRTLLLELPTGLHEKIHGLEVSCRRGAASLRSEASP